MDATVIVGIDVSKDRLDVHVRPEVAIGNFHTLRDTTLFLSACALAAVVMFWL